MANGGYNPQIVDRRADYISQGFQALASGIQDFQKKQEEEQMKRELIQRDINKSDIIMQHALGEGRITRDDWNAYSQLQGTKRADAGQAMAQNIATDMILRQQARVGTFLKTPEGRPVGIYGPTGIHMLPESLLNPPTHKPGEGVVLNGQPTGMIFGAKDNPVALPTAGQVHPNYQKPVLDASGKQIGEYNARGNPSYYPGQKPEAADSWEKLGNDLKAQSGGDISDWANVQNPKTNPDGSIQGDAPVKAGSNQLKRIKLTGAQQAVIAARHTALSGIQSPAPAPQLTAQDQQALQWAQSNPSDPRAAAILQKLGVK